MDWPVAILVLLGPVLLLMALGMPVAFAFLAANILGAFLFLGGVNGVYQLIANASVSVTSFLLVPIPLFVLMGELFFHSGLARRIFDSLDKLVGGLPGRLAYITVGGGTLFGALSGASMANTASQRPSWVWDVKNAANAVPAASALGNKFFFVSALSRSLPEKTRERTMFRAQISSVFVTLAAVSGDRL